MVRIQSLRFLTWDVPRPVRFDSDVRKRVYCRSQQIGDHESNSGRWHRGVTTYSPCCWHSPAHRIPKGRTEKVGNKPLVNEWPVFPTETLLMLEGSRPRQHNSEIKIFQGAIPLHEVLERDAPWNIHYSASVLSWSRALKHQ